MCSGSEAGSYLRLIDFVHHLTLGLRVIKKKTRSPASTSPTHLPTTGEIQGVTYLFRAKREQLKKKTFTRMGFGVVGVGPAQGLNAQAFGGVAWLRDGG